MSQDIKPIYMRPTSISPHKKRAYTGTDDLSFIVSRERLAVFAANICNELEHPLTIIDFGAEDRVESTNIFHAIRTSCETIRLCTDSTLCTKCDAHHASIFRDISNINSIESIIRQRIDALAPLPYFSMYYRKPVLQKWQDKEHSRYYVEYFCPVLGYKEMFFPIIIDEVIMGVLFVGQFEVEHETIHELIRNDFLENQLETVPEVQEYLKHATATHMDNIVDRITAPPSTNYPIENVFNVEYGFRKNTSKDIITPSECEELVQKTCYALDRFEEAMHDELEHKREKHISNFMDKIEFDFFGSFSSFSDISYQQREEARKSFATCFYKIIKEFDLLSITVFSDVTAPGLKIRGLAEYFSVDEKSPKGKENTQDENKIYYKTDNIRPPITKPFVPICSLENESLFEGFVEPIEKQDTIILVYSSWAARFIVKHLDDPYIRSVYSSMFRTMASYITSFFSAMSAMHASYLQNKFELTLHMYKHECTHIAKNLGSKNNEILLYLGKKISPKISDLCDDISSSILLINNIAYIIGAVIGTLDSREYILQSEDVSVFKELLYKWGKSFKKQIDEKNVSIDVRKVSYLDLERPFTVKINKQLLEIMLYNIVDNAVKYCHWGSSIYLDFRRILPSSMIGVISVTSYGPEISASRDPYKAYVRGVDDINPIKGDGLGLYMVDQVSKLVDIQVYHKCKRISKYNVSLIDEYLYRDLQFYEKDENLTRILVDEKKQLGRELDKIVNHHKTHSISDIDLAEEDLVNDIEKGTFETTFYVEMSLT